MGIIVTKKLGLAAYLKVKGAKLVRRDGKGFQFETTKSKENWEVEYANSSEALFNSSLIELNQLNREQV